MTDKEIIKVLEIHINEFDKTGISADNNRLDKLTLDLINRQQAEIEQWKEEANKYQKLWCIAMDDIEIAQFGAI